MSTLDDGQRTRSNAPSDPNPFPNLRSRRRRGLRVTTAAAVALGLAVGGGAVAEASTTGTNTPTSTPAAPFGPGGTPPAAFGTVASVGTNTFTLTARDGTTVTVDVSSTTTYLDQAVTSPSLADVKVGAHVAVFGTDSSNTVTATKVAIGGPGGMGRPGGFGGPGGTPPAAFGTVASVGTNTFTLTARDGTTVTVDVSSTTTYLDQAVTSPSLADVKVGAHVAVFGTDSSNTVTATKVAIGGPGGMGRPGGFGGPGGTPPAAFGTVASVGTNTFTLTARDGTTVTVDVSSTTTYLDQAVTSPSLADVKVGAHVAVFGTDSSNTVTATKVAIGGPGGMGRPGGFGGPGGTPPAAFGTVASVGTNTFTLTARDGTTVTVDVSSTTTYLDQAVTSPSLADVKVGAHVAVFGTDSSNTVTATKVAIGGPGGMGRPGGFGGPGGAAGDGPMGPAPSTGTSASPTNANSGSTSGSGSSVLA